MHIIYKVVKKTNDELLSTSANILKHNYKLPYSGRFGLFAFEHPLYAELFFNGLAENVTIIKGQTTNYFPISYAIDSIFNIKEHSNFWKLFHFCKRPPTDIEIIKAKMTPRLLPIGSIVIFDWKFISEIKNIDLEILQYRKGK